LGINACGRNTMTVRRINGAPYHDHAPHHRGAME
jgi:hypothetical protein